MIAHRRLRFRQPAAVSERLDKLLDGCPAFVEISTRKSSPGWARLNICERALGASLANQAAAGEISGPQYVINAASANIFGWCGVVRLEPPHGHATIAASVNISATITTKITASKSDLCHMARA